MIPTRIPAAIEVALCMAVCSPALQAAEPATQVSAKTDTAVKADAAAKAEGASKAETVAQTSDKQARDPNKRVCKNAQPTGTRLGKRICKKQSEWDEIERAARDTVQRSQTQSQMTNMAGGQG
jgi:hypothetical protein